MGILGRKYFLHMDTDQFSAAVRGCGESISGQKDGQMNWRMWNDWQTEVSKGYACREKGRRGKMAEGNGGSSCPTPAPCT